MGGCRFTLNRKLDNGPCMLLQMPAQKSLKWSGCNSCMQSACTIYIAGIHVGGPAKTGPAPMPMFMTITSSQGILF